VEADVICHECREAELVESRENHHYVECGLDNVVLLDTVISRCPKCTAYFVNIKSVTGLHRALALAIISKAERLSPSEVKFLRKSLGWSGVDFASQMHVTIETVSRWEREDKPQPMKEPYELLLRTAVAHGKRIDEYEVGKMADVARLEPKKRRYKMKQEPDGWQVAV
jgi:putative transcriptional regulator